MKSTILLFGLLTMLNFSCAQDNSDKKESTQKTKTTMKADAFPFQLTDEEWRKKLTPEQYRVLREKGTERPFTGKYNLHKEEGAYHCAACGAELFSSEMKFDSNCGWPSFDTEIAGGKIIKVEDRTHGMIRTEIVCANCGSHLGHLFDDGPTETGLRYCVNSESLDFKNDSLK